VLILIAYLNFDRFPTLQEEFNRNIEALAKWIEGAIQRFKRWSFEKCASSCLMNEWCSCGDDQRFLGEEGFGRAISR
jgi:hypothetical protein